MAQNKQTNYSCDTLPEPQHLAFHQRTRSVSPAIGELHIHTDDNASSAFDAPTREEILSQLPPPAQPIQVDPLGRPGATAAEDSDSDSGSTLNTSGRERKLCVRHLRMADEG